MSLSLRQMLAITGEAVLLIDAETRRLLYASDAAHDILGRVPIEGPDGAAGDAMLVEDAALAAFLARAVTSSQPLPGRVVRAHDGAALSARACRAVDEQGAVRILMRVEAETELSLRFRKLSERIGTLDTEVRARRAAEARLARHGARLEETIDHLRRISEIDTNAPDYLIQGLEIIMAACKCRGAVIAAPVGGAMTIIEALGDIRTDLPDDAIAGQDAATSIAADGDRDLVEPATTLLRQKAGMAVGSLIGMTLTELGRPMAALILSEGAADPQYAHEARQIDILCQSLASLIVRARVEREYRHAAKMQSIGELTGGVAHDFNNILAVVLGNAELLEMAAADVPDASDARELAGEIRDAAQRGATLTSRLLSYARKQPLRPQAVSIDAIVRDIAPMLRRTIGADIALEIAATARLWTARVDGNQLENALLNLVINARDAMPDGGQITIETANVTLDHQYAARQTEVQSGQYVMLAVTDTGSGMSAEVMRDAFEPFFTTKPVGKGSGLGLSMVFGFTKQSGGHTMLYSERGVGTTVKLYFPRQAAHAADPAQGHLLSVEPPQGTAHILLVEDDPALLKYSERVLVSLGYTVRPALDGSAATALLHKERFDLLLTDVILPGPRNGVAVARAAVSAQPGIKVIYMSGYTKNAVVHHGEVDADVTLIMKPFSRNELAERLRQVLETE